MRDAFLLLLLGHMLGDYVFQTSQIARKKSKEIKYLMTHACILWASCFLVMLPDWNGHTFFWTLVLAVFHGGIDLIKYRFRNRAFTKTIRYFILDQTMHVATVSVISSFVVLDRVFLSPAIAFVGIVVIVDSYLVDIITYLIYDAKNGAIYTRDLLNYLLLGLSFPIIMLHPIAGVLFISAGLGIQILCKGPNRSLLTKYLLCASLNGVFYLLWRWCF